MRKLNRELLLGTAVSMVLAAGCGRSPAPVAKPTPGPGITIVNESPEESASVPQTQAPPGEPAQPPGPPPDEAALAGESTEQLIAKLGSQTERMAVSRVLAKRGDANVVESLTAALRHDQWSVRAGAAFTLGQMGVAADSAKAALEQAAASDAEQTVRDAAAFALDALAEE